MAYHRPVLLDESIDALNIQPKGVYVDLTFGGGGHSRHVLEKLGKRGKLIAFDQDGDAKGNLIADNRLLFVQANFRYLRNFLTYYKMERVDGILADLGVSSHQFDKAERGFSFRASSKLDMRMNRASEKSAVEVLNAYPEEKLLAIFREYGELREARRIAKAIVEERASTPVATTGDLERLLGNMVPERMRSKFLAQVYQAIRIEVNEELEALKEMLVQTSEHIKPGGRLVVITYHSLEDRLVKNYMKTGNLEGALQKDFYGNVESPWKLVNRKVVVPGEEEIRENNRARSAKLRIAERIA